MALPAPSAPATTAEAVSQLLATGEWAAGADAPASDLPVLLPRPPAAAPVAPPPPAAAPVPPVTVPDVAPSYAPVLSAAPPAVPALVVPPAVPAPTPEPAPPAPAAVPPAPRAAPARSSLEAALADLLPPQEGVAGATPEPTVPFRVQLGFRDGTSAPLDPRSSQFAELESLAQSLTQRD